MTTKWNEHLFRGHAAESISKAWFQAMGHVTFTPEVPNGVVDFMVKHRVTGRVFQVQSKTVHHTATAGSHRYYGSSVRRGSGQLYEPQDVDLFTLVDIPADIWVIPASVVLDAAIPNIVLGRLDDREYRPRQPDWSRFKRTWPVQRQPVTGDNE